MTVLPLFRSEALEHQRDTWLGEIVLARPLSFALLTWFFVGCAAIGISFLVWGEYTKKARVSGYLAPDQGLVKVFSRQAGTVTALHVQDGQAVRRGEVLATVSTERTTSRGDTQVAIATQLEVRRNSIHEEIAKTQQMYDEQARAAKDRLDRLQDDLRRAASAIQTQEQRVKLSFLSLERSARLLEDKYVSELAVQDKRAELLDQESRLHDLQRSRNAAEREAASVASELKNLPLKARSAMAALERLASEIAASSFENEARREELILAPQDGTVTAIQATLGKQAAPVQPLMSLIPATARLQAELYVPSRAIAFVRGGNVARLQYQAFPYQKFGSHQGRVVRVSRTAIPAQELPWPAPLPEPYYVVVVMPEHDYVTAYGQQEPLRSGMQVNADIWLGRRSLIEWIMEPLFSVSGRL